MRTRRSVVHFSLPFRLSGIDTVQAAGDYEIDEDEEQIEGISWMAYRRIATLMHLPAIGAKGATSQLVAVDAAELEEALRRDREHIQQGAHSGADGQST